MWYNLGMTTQSKPAESEYQTYQIGVAYLVLALLKRLGIAEIIDSVLQYQPAIGASYGTLALVIIINRLSFDPQPLYTLGEWAHRHGIDRLLGIDAAWLDDDRLGALMEALAKHAVVIWLKVIGRAVRHFAIVLEWLHADTTSVYFEGAYEDEQGQPIQEPQAPRLLRGYNKDGKPNNLQFVLSLITSRRVPLWYRPWDGNHSDEGVYLADLTHLRLSGLALDNTVLVFDRKGCNRPTLLELCRSHQLFLGAHPWTETAKTAWDHTWQELQAGTRSWTAVDYVPRQYQGRPSAERPQYRVCEVPYELPDETDGRRYTLRWVFTWNSSKAEQDARERQKDLAAGEQALQRIARWLGKYDYTSRAVIEKRLATALTKAQAHAYYHYTLWGSDDRGDWHLEWSTDPDTIAQAERFDGVALICTNVPVARLTAGEVLKKYKEQVNVEQTIAFIKSPVQIRPMWLHSPQRLAGLTLLIMLAVLVAGLIEYQVRQEIATNKQLLKGLMPENRDNPHPTATKLLKTFQDYALIVVRHADGQEDVHYPELRPVQQQIMTMLGLLPPQPNSS